MRLTNVTAVVVLLTATACSSLHADDLEGAMRGDDAAEAREASTGGGACAPCTECTAPDRCIENDRTGERFCAVACDGDRCAPGFVCSAVARAERLCVPATGTCREAAGAGSSSPAASGQTAPQSGDTGGPTGANGEPFCANRRIVGLAATPAAAGAAAEEMRAYGADAVNHLRAQTGLPPLVRDACLDRIAQAATDAFASDGRAHGYFLANCMNASRAFGDACECGWGQENQGGAGGTNVSWKDATHRPLCSMMGEPEGKGHRKNIQSREWTRIGVGVAMRGGMLVWSHEFGR